MKFDRHTTKIFFFNCICIYCKKEHYVVIQTNSPIERRILPYELPLRNLSCKMKKSPYRQIRVFQTYLSLENNFVMLHFPTDSARSTGTSPKLKQRSLSPVHWQQPRAACQGFKGEFTESWCPLLTIRSLSSEKDTKNNSSFLLYALLLLLLVRGMPKVLQGYSAAWKDPWLTPDF